MSYALELEELHKRNKQAQIDSIYVNLKTLIDKIEKHSNYVDKFISMFLRRTDACRKLNCYGPDCHSCNTDADALSELSRKIQFVDELYKEDNKRIQERINLRYKNQYTVRFIEYILDIKFEGDIEDKDAVKNFINDNLPKVNESINQE